MEEKNKEKNKKKRRKNLKENKKLEINMEKIKEERKIERESYKEKSRKERPNFNFEETVNFFESKKEQIISGGKSRIKVNKSKDRHLMDRILFLILLNNVLSNVLKALYYHYHSQPHWRYHYNNPISHIMKMNI